MPCCMTDSLSAFQSSGVGVWMVELENISLTLSVLGVKSSGLYRSKNSPVAYSESSKFSNVSPRSFAISFDALIHSYITAAK